MWLFRLRQIETRLALNKQTVRSVACGGKGDITTVDSIRILFINVGSAKILKKYDYMTTVTYLIHKIGCWVVAITY